MSDARPRVIQPVMTRFASAKEADAADRAWQHSLTPLERMAYLEELRQYAYGSEALSAPRVPIMSRRPLH